MTSTTMELADKYADISWDDNNKARDALEQRIKELERDAKRWKFTMWWQDQHPRPENIQNCLSDMHRWARDRGALGPNSEELQRATDRAMSEAALTKAVEISQELKLP